MEFSIKGGPNYLKLSIDTVYGFPDSTCHWGGYECTLHIDLKIEGFSVKEYFSSSTGEIFDFYQKLKQGQKTLKDSVNFQSFEENLEFSLDYDLNGNVVISGTFHGRSYNNR